MTKFDCTVSHGIVNRRRQRCRMSNRRRSFFDFIYEANMITGTVRAILFILAFSAIGGSAVYFIKQL
ncbi:hypothetical protein JL39_07500 [Rhizobium sp. YS-1r]|nr:hypothetical protein JL39_07500 [Rhizobium sp. YS-1r]